MNNEVNEILPMIDPIEGYIGVPQRIEGYLNIYTAFHLIFKQTASKQAVHFL